MANIDVMYSSKSNEWTTPQDFFDKLNAEFHFNLDPCATDENHKCDRYFTKDTDGLKQDWGGTAYSSTRLMAGKLANGSRSPTERVRKKIPLSLCSYRHGQTQSIFTISFITDRKYA